MWMLKQDMLLHQLHCLRILLAISNVQLRCCLHVGWVAWYEMILDHCTAQLDATVCLLHAQGAHSTRQLVCICINSSQHATQVWCIPWLMFKTCRCASLGYDQLHQRLKRCKHDYGSSTYVACKYYSAVRHDVSATLLRGYRMLTTHAGGKAWPLRVLPGWTASLFPLKHHCQRHTCKMTCNMRQSHLCRHMTLQAHAAQLLATRRW